MSAEHDIARETSIQATGLLTEARRVELLTVLEQFGMSHTILSIGNPRDPLDPLIEDNEQARHSSYADLHSREQFFGYEHIVDFRSQDGQEFAKRPLMALFGALVVPRAIRARGTHMGNRLNPAELELIVRSRDQVGFPKLPGSSSSSRNPEVIDKVVQIGSMFRYHKRLEDPAFRSRIDGFHDVTLVRFKAFDALTEALAAKVDR